MINILNRCRFESTCIPYPSFKKVNPSSQRIIDGSCSSGCISTISYTYDVFFSLDLNFTSTISWKSLEGANINFILGSQTSELTILSDLFTNYSNVIYWRVDLTLNNGFSNGFANLIFKKNSLPSNGYCFVDTYNGQSMTTYFGVICLNWIDSDGSISKYEFYCNIICLKLYQSKI